MQKNKTIFSFTLAVAILILISVTSLPAKAAICIVDGLQTVSVEEAPRYKMLTYPRGDKYHMDPNDPAFGAFNPKNSDNSDDGWHGARTFVITVSVIVAIILAYIRRKNKL